MPYKKYNPIIKLYFIILYLTMWHSNAMLITTSKERNKQEEKLQQEFCSYIKYVDRIGNRDLTKIIATYLVQDDDELEKFMKMPLGKALEWYTFTRQL